MLNKYFTYVSELEPLSCSLARSFVVNDSQFLCTEVVHITKSDVICTTMSSPSSSSTELQTNKKIVV